ncbi:MAG: heat-inducible transcriptional repressor HrcA [Syntrophorhabdaceae bacterium]|nr:heat-inducible transcriptional repressor HrcA [Syntrophorhabdaceae bacterium]
MVRFILNPREKEILIMIIEGYIAAAEPIGSEKLSKILNYKWSSATIRNIMAGLEERGFLSKPHSVAGRIPTYKAFRYYLENLQLPEYPGKKILNNINSMLKQQHKGISSLMNNVSKALATISRYTGIVVEPHIDMMLFKEIEFVKLSRNTVLTVFVTSSGTVHTRIVETEEELDERTLNYMKNYLNNKFSGKPFYTLKEGIKEDMDKDRFEYREILKLINESLQTIINEKEKREVYIEGVSKIIDIPEFLDVQRLKEILDALEKKEKLLKILDKCIENEGIRVIMGDETDMKEMRCMSIITSTYKVGEKNYGVLGVIGPIRMDYSKIIPLVDYTAKTVTDILKLM